MRQALANTKVFACAYIVLMLLTYYLGQLGSRSPIISDLEIAEPNLLSFPLMLHVGAMLALFWICLVRGAIIHKKWLALLPVVVFAFEFIPKLSVIPIVPSVYHLLAIVIGVLSPIVAVSEQSVY